MTLVPRPLAPHASPGPPSAGMSRAANRRTPVAAQLLAALACLLASGEARSQSRGAEPTAKAFALTADSQLVAATAAESREVLTADDRFTTQLSQFDLESRLGRLDVTREDFDQFVAEQALDWEPELLEKVAAAAATVRQWIDAQQLRLPLPERILLVQTTGKEEGGAAYCRGAAIVLPAPMVAKARPARLSSLLAHELFHILSANNPALQRRLYAAIGFRPCPSITLPPELARRKLTNPDGPGLDYFINLAAEDEAPLRAVPLLLASVDRYDPQRGGSFFSFLQFQLLAVEPGELGRWRPTQIDGKPQMIAHEDNAAFFDQIGRNTKYIVHPDEILADNFVFLLQGKQDLPSPEVLKRMRQVLAAP